MSLYSSGKTEAVDFLRIAAKLPVCQQTTNWKANISDYYKVSMVYRVLQSMCKSYIVLLTLHSFLIGR